MKKRKTGESKERGEVGESSKQGKEKEGRVRRWSTEPSWPLRKTKKETVKNEEVRRNLRREKKKTLAEKRSHAYL